ncbi:hypothetical protein ADIARSV_3515 [Arcticibacter svalbardensis MN12-7]|uniref:Uncharacterized protein n=1 Tax=Arcticibacter svalbardensis MN12-7 TaxID=1150600 RepID=R9GWI3_9SPHI|nr:hypothetical protein [Arcticibacter svalbardensis]EOR93304.1 hypothetical protein ADIARSV_3515 [Arcticibacter svalbardensis MN12-7]
MKITDRFSFGRYRGLTILEVYQGKPRIDKEMLEQYFNRKIEGIDPKSYGQNLLREVLTLEISDTLIRVVPFGLAFNKDYSETINLIFSSSNIAFNRSLGEYTHFQDFIGYKWSKNGIKEILTAGGCPEYINWCINEIDGFFIDPSELITLESYQVFRYTGIEVKQKVDDIYVYKAVNSPSEFNFPLTTIQANELNSEMQ